MAEPHSNNNREKQPFVQVPHGFEGDAGAQRGIPGRAQFLPIGTPVIPANSALRPMTSNVSGGQSYPSTTFQPGANVGRTPMAPSFPGQQQQTYGDYYGGAPRQTSTISILAFQAGGTEGMAIHMTPSPSMNTMPPQSTSWLAALGSGGLPGEPPLLEELEINLGHIKTKTFSVLNPFRPIDKHIMDDTDLMGPLLFCLLFGASLLLNGKIQFGFIYGVALLGWFSIWGILNLMSDSRIDTLRAASVLGYCLLPMVFLSCLSILLPLQGFIGLISGSATVLWCTTTASNMFVTVMGMRDQRILVAYPIALLYACFALMTIF